MLTGTCPFWHDDLMTTITKHITDKPLPLRQRAQELNIPPEIENVVLQMLEKNPAERPQSMAVVEAMLCEAQIAARIQTEWDDLELPAVDEDWQKKLADRMPSPRSRRLRRMAVGLGLVAAAGLGLALYFGLRRPKEIVTYTPVYVEVTKTEEPESVAPWLRKAGVAAAGEQFFEPANDSALYYIQQAEAQAKRVGTSSGGAAMLRRLYGNQFRSLGNSLLEARLSDLASVRFGEALRFLPGDADLRTKMGIASGIRSGSDSSSATAESRRLADAPVRAAADLFSAAASGRFSAARVALARLRETDKDGRQGARLADEFRRHAQTLWDGGKRDEARRYYQLVVDLDPKDSISQERAESKDEGKPAPAAAEPVATPETAKVAKKKAAGEGSAASTTAEEDANAPRDRAASAKAAGEGGAALSRGDLARAQAAFDRAVRADSTNPDAVTGLAQVAFESARYTEALDYGRRAVRLQPKSAAHHVVVGDSYFKLLRYDDALASYTRAQTLAPNDEGIKTRIGRVKARLGE
jgi:tetratricopeptide (TPR) repeat protein